MAKKGKWNKMMWKKREMREEKERMVHRKQTDTPF
jgi:hypothetical protein